MVPLPRDVRHHRGPRRCTAATARHAVPGAVVVHPGAESASRRWPAERYIVVVRRLRALGRRVIVTGGPTEDALVLDIAARADLPARDLLRGGLPFGELSALVAHAALVVCGDTDLAHLAVAHGTPSVTLFGPVSPRQWGPRAQSATLLCTSPARRTIRTATSPTRCCCGPAPTRSSPQRFPEPGGRDGRSHLVRRNEVLTP